MLVMRMYLPDEWEDDGELTDEGEQYMMMYAALLEKSGMHGFRVMRTNT